MPAVGAMLGQAWDTLFIGALSLGICCSLLGSFLFLQIIMSLKHIEK